MGLYCAAFLKHDFPQAESSAISFSGAAITGCKSIQPSVFAPVASQSVQFRF
jgi:hypothetical protein